MSQPNIIWNIANTLLMYRRSLRFGLQWYNTTPQDKAPPGWADFLQKSPSHPFWKPQSRLATNGLLFQVICPQNGTAVSERVEKGTQKRKGRRWKESCRRDLSVYRRIARHFHFPCCREKMLSRLPEEVCVLLIMLRLIWS